MKTKQEYFFSETVNKLLAFISLEGVGKTSMIITIVSETFPRTVMKTYHPVNLSQELYMLPIDTNTVLVDSSCNKAV